MTAAEAAARFPSAVYLAASLDPLTAAHARMVERAFQPGRPLVVLLTDPPDPLLPARSRAELAAALERVDAVVLPLADGGPDVAGAADVVREDAADLERRRELIGHVHRRHAR